MKIIVLLSKHGIHSVAKELFNSIITKRFLRYRIEGNTYPVAVMYCLRDFFLYKLT